MPNYVSTSITRLCPDGPPRPSKTPGIYLPPKYGAPNLGPTVDTSPLVSAADKQFIMEVVGTFLFYARMVDHTMLPAVTFISKKQSAPTEQTLAATHMLLRYAVSHPSHCVTFKACDMVLKVISDGSHLSQENANLLLAGTTIVVTIPMPLPPSTGPFFQSAARSLPSVAQLPKQNTLPSTSMANMHTLNVSY